LTLCALVPLVPLLYVLLVRGGARLSPELFTQLAPGADTSAGGIGSAVAGTCVVLGVATAGSLPPSVLTGIYRAEYGGASRLAAAVRFAARVLAGIPSILAGVFAYAAVVILTGSFSALAGAAAMGLLMMPIVILTTEQALRAVPSEARLSALGMGATHAQMLWRVAVPNALPALRVGVLLAVARAMGEAAPLLFTALFSDYWFEGHLNEPIASLPVLIYKFSANPLDSRVDLAWAASLVLVSLVLASNVAIQSLLKRWRERT
jgi:phosphate transport system permease protein